MHFVLVLATGKFFNKVDQAESLDCYSALWRVLAPGEGYDPRINCSGGGGFQFPVATMSCNVKHCDLSVTTSGGHTLWVVSL